MLAPYFFFPNMVDFFEIKKSKDTMKHVTGTYIWIIGKGLLFAPVCFFKKFFLLRIKIFFGLPSKGNILKEEKFTDEPFK